MSLFLLAMYDIVVNYKEEDLTMKVIMSCSEWFPCYDIEKHEIYKDASPYDRVVEMTEENYIVYKGLLLQFEKLQEKLEKQWKGAKK